MTKNTPELSAESLKDLCLTAIDDVKGKLAIAIDVSQQTDVMSWLVVATGTSTRHIKAVAESVASDAKAAGVQALGVEGGVGTDWYLVDLGDVVVNVMLPETRASYDLESLWSGGDVTAPGINAL